MFRRISFSFLFCAFLGLFWAPTENAQDSAVRIHQPGQAVFGSVLPEAIDWKTFKPSRLR